MKLQVFKSTSQFPSIAVLAKRAISIGNFDGCHIGHQKLLKHILRVSAGEGHGRAPCQSTVVSFEPRPEDFFRPTGEVLSLFSEAQKIRAFEELGISEFVIQRFDEGFSQVSKTAFLEDYLQASMAARYVSVGENFCFGHERQGTAYWLQQSGRSRDIYVKISAPSLYGGEVVSSTRIRRALHDGGSVAEVSEMLGRPYLLEGTISKGRQIGRTIDVPTANLTKTKQLVPRSGVYCGYVWLSLEGEEKPPVLSLPKSKISAVFNIGYRPTVESSSASRQSLVHSSVQAVQKDRVERESAALGLLQKSVSIEAHLLEGDWGLNDLYGVNAGYWFTHRLRDEIKFDGLGALKSQIAKDIQLARNLLEI